MRKSMMTIGAVRGRSRSDGVRYVCAGGVVFDRRGRVALVKQRDRGLRLRWTFPKGRIDGDESPEAAALREVREETGLRTRIATYLGRHEGKRRITHYFTMELLRVAGSHDAETVELRFVTVERARRMLRSARDCAVLDRALRGRRAPTRHGIASRAAG
jgi:8-oxo-dGTP pyrophosphatase MutT (NUDIX family)